MIDTRPIEEAIVAGLVAAGVTIRGEDGKSIHVGEGAPPAELNVPGDSYVDTVTGDLWERNGTWQRVGTLRGPIGPTGATGAAGRNGTDGTDGRDGADGQGIRGERGATGATGPRGTDGKDGEPGRQGPPGLNWRGAYDAAAEYQADDAVQVLGSSYVALRTLRGVHPPGAGWDLLAQRGKPGLTGPPGMNGGGGGSGTANLSDSTPLVESGAGAAGTAGAASRGDHVHPADAGGTGDKNYVHSQLVPATVWPVTHNLGKRPSVTVIDSGDNWVMADVVYLSDNALEIHTSVPFGGTATLN